MRLRTVSVVVLAACAATAACSAILDLEPPPIPDDAGAPDATSGSDAAPNDATATDAGQDVVSAADGPVQTSDAAVCSPLDAAAPDGATGTTYFSLRDTPVDDAGTPAWTFYEPSNVNTFARNFQGGTFDGRYIYLVPNDNGTVTRYDTHGPFATGASWSTFDTTTLAPGAQGFSGAVFDGQFVYFVPYHAPTATYEGLVVRYDTTASFVGPGGWTAFDLTTLPISDAGTPLVGFNGGVFDGHAVYLVPYYDGAARLSRVARYVLDGGVATPEAGVVDAGDAGDAGAEHDAGDAGAHDAGAVDAGSMVEAGPPQFGAASQWSAFDMSVPDNNAAGYLGGVFDGRYAYLAPYANNAQTSGVVSRYDTTATFAASSSWSFYDLSALDTDAVGFLGAAFDGRYVYLVPHVHGVAARYDTQGPSLAHTPSWTTFDLSEIIANDAGVPTFSGAAFDGRFVYYVPATNNGAPSGVVTRYDTWSTFESPCAWSTFDISTVNASATSYFGAIYDGQYLYFIPKGTWVARFDTKTPGAMPALPAFNGSFY